MAKIIRGTAPPRQVLWNSAITPAGRLLLGVSDKGALCRASFLRARRATDIVAEWQAEWPRTAFMGGKLPQHWQELPLLMIGTAFQVAVWRAIMKIPQGETASYGGIAIRVGAPRAARAVGTACGLNRLAYIVPCHRVVAAHGLGGYGPGGLAIKRALLKAEGVVVAD